MGRGHVGWGHHTKDTLSASQALHLASRRITSEAETPGTGVSEFLLFRVRGVLSPCIEGGVRSRMHLKETHLYLHYILIVRSVLLLEWRF